jgi:hypothetical protein
MKKIAITLALILCGSCLSAMVRAGVDLGPTGVYYDGYYYDDGEYYDYWYGPGWYWGTYYDNAPDYYAWRRRHWGGPYYWRQNHYYRQH